MRGQSEVQLRNEVPAVALKGGGMKYRTQIRLPHDVAAWLKAKAKHSGRSMNAQLVRELERCQTLDESKQAA